MFQTQQRDALPALTSLILAALVLLVYWPLCHADFVSLDDPAFVYSNPHVLKGLTWEGIGWAFRPGEGDYWHPLTWLSLMLDVTLFGPNPGRLHLVNILFHAANVALVFQVLARWTGNIRAAALAAALFALHPLRVESVAWISERKDVLSTLFWLLALWAYVRYVRRCEVRSERSEVENRASQLAARTSALSPLTSPHYWLALVFFALGLMSKAMLVTVPFTLLLLDYWPLRRWETSTARALVREKIPFIALSLASTVLTYWGQQHALESFAQAGFAPLMRVENAIVACSSYLAQLLCPTHLAVWYLHPGHWSAVRLGTSIVLLAGLSLTTLLLRHRLPYLFVGWFWFLITLIPVLGLTHGWIQFMADRFTYVPLLGLFVAIAWGLHDIMLPWPGRKPLFLLTAIALALGCTIATRRQLNAWHDSESLFRHAIAATGDNWIAYNDLGLALKEKGRTDEAVDAFQRAIRIHPNFADAHDNFGAELLARGRIEDATVEFRRAVELAPADFRAHNNLGVALERNGQWAEAIAEYRTAIGVRPDYIDAYNNLSEAFFRQNNFTDALPPLQTAVRIDPSDAETHFHLGMTFARLGRTAEAIDQFQECLRFRPDDAGAHGQLGALLLQQGNAAQAAAQFEQNVRLHPNDSAAHNNLGTACYEAGRLEDAISQFREALRLDPANAKARDNLDSALTDQSRTNRAGPPRIP